MQRPTADIEGCRIAHARLLTSLDIADHESGDPSRLPGWTIGHVLGHLALNAQAMVNRIEAATRGECIEQYPGGVQGRSAGIAAAATKTLDQHREDVRFSAARLDETFANLDEETWGRPVRTVGGPEHSVALLPFRRWREVEAHHVDLRIGFEPSDWSAEFIDRLLPRLLAGLPKRTDPNQLSAWLLGRGELPDIEPWG